MLKDQGHLNQLFNFLQRNANRPQIQNKGDSNLPNELLEIFLTSLRVRAMETTASILPSSDLRVHVGSDLITFYAPSSKQFDGKVAPNLYKSFYIEASLNSSSISVSHQSKAYMTVTLSYLKQNPEYAYQQLEGLILDSDVFSHEDDLTLQAIHSASILIVNDQVDIEKVYYQLKALSQKHKDSISRALHNIPVFQVRQSDLI